MHRSLVNMVTTKFMGYERMKDIPLDDIESNKNIIQLEDLLAQCLAHPQNNEETVCVSASGILKLLKVRPVSRKETFRAARWLRANGFRILAKGKCWKIKIGVYPCDGLIVV